MMSKYLLVTDYEKVNPNAFYLTDWWLEKGTNCCCEMTPQQIRDMAKRGELFEAFIVSAASYDLYPRTDSQMVYIDRDSNVIVHCEPSIIENGHKHREEYEI